MEKTKNKDLLKCPKCDSAHTYIRITTKERVCQNCGHIWKIKNEKTELSQNKREPDGTRP